MNIFCVFFLSPQRCYNNAYSGSSHIFDWLAYRGKRGPDNSSYNAVIKPKKFSIGAVFRQKDRSKAAEFPDDWLRNGTEKDLEKFFIPEDKRMKRGNN